jgi:hypothetical protein
MSMSHNNKQGEAGHGVYAVGDQFELPVPVLGPLQDGAVVTGAVLAVLVRETAINACRLALTKARQEEGSFERPHLRRRCLIREIEQQHGEVMLPGKFYRSQFFGR